MWVKIERWQYNIFQGGKFEKSNLYLIMSGSKIVILWPGCDSLFELVRPLNFGTQMDFLSLHQVINFVNVRHEIFI